MVAPRGSVAAVGLTDAGHYVEAARAAQNRDPQAEFLFIGSYHMDNPGRDVHNTKADDVLSKKRQREIAEVVRLIERYRPTKVMVEAETASQDKINTRFAESCKGSRPLARNETEQLGFRIACDMGLKTVYAVDWYELGPIKDEDSIDYLKAVERHHQQKQYDLHLAIGKAEADKGPASPRPRNSAGHAEAPELTHVPQAERDGILPNRHARLVIYGAGHGNYLRQLAIDSGIYQVHEPLDWLSPRQGRH